MQKPKAKSKNAVKLITYLLHRPHEDVVGIPANSNKDTVRIQWQANKLYHVSKPVGSTSCTEATGLPRSYYVLFISRKCPVRMACTTQNNVFMDAIEMDHFLKRPMGKAIKMPLKMRHCTDTIVDIVDRMYGNDMKS